MRFLNLLAQPVDPQNRRAVDRISDPGLVAYFWDGGKPHANRVRDISHDGAYLETAGRWYEGTIIALVLQPKKPEADAELKTEPRFHFRAEVQPDTRPAVGLLLNDHATADHTPGHTSSAPAAQESIKVVCRVARQGPDGIGVEFPRTHPEERKKLRDFIAACAEKRRLGGTK